MSRLRIALPPLDSLTLHSELAFARLSPDGRVSESGHSSLLRLGQLPKTPALECFLHPLDSLLTSIELPPLPAARIKAAVSCAAQALILGQSERMHVAHSGRGTDGQVQLAWVPKAGLEQLAQLIRQSGLKLRGLYPAPYALPVPPVGQISACYEAEHLLLRHSAEQGSVQPLFAESLEQLVAGGSGLQWIGDGAPANALAQLPHAQRWSGPVPNWGLHGGVTQESGQAPRWGRAMACCALALVVWVAGLNLYAVRQAAEGQQLKAQMSQRVKQAFPQLPVILNPLQQARQQLAARQDPALADPGESFSSLMQRAGAAMPFMVGVVQRLTFAQGQLHLALLSEMPRTGADAAWQVALNQAGVVATRNDDGWTLSATAEQAAEDNRQLEGDADE